MQFLFFLLFLIQVVPIRSNDDEIPAHHAREFDNYMKVFNRQYKSEDEKKHRLKTFSKNLHKIEELNQQFPHTVYGLTSMSDWTEEEKKGLLMKNDQKREREAQISGSMHYNVSMGRPLRVSGFTNEEADWRKKGKVTPIKNQGSCGSCWAFATVAVVESHFMIKKKSKYDLSEQDLLNCDNQSYGCEGGFLHTALQYAQTNGIQKESSAPYKGRQTSCMQGSGKIRIDGSKRIDKNEQSIVDHVRKYGPVTAVFQVSDGFFAYKNGVFSECTGQGGYHAVAIVGYGKCLKSGKKYWIIKNSWGTNWGDNGYVNFERGRNLCGIESDTMSAVIR